MITRNQPHGIEIAYTLKYSFPYTILLVPSFSSYLHSYSLNYPCFLVSRENKLIFRLFSTSTILQQPILMPSIPNPCAVYSRLLLCISISGQLLTLLYTICKLNSHFWNSFWMSVIISISTLLRSNCCLLAVLYLLPCCIHSMQINRSFYVFISLFNEFKSLNTWHSRWILCFSICTLPSHSLASVLPQST